MSMDTKGCPRETPALLTWVVPSGLDRGRVVSQAGGERRTARLGCGGIRELPGAAAVRSRGRAGGGPPKGEHAGHQGKDLSLAPSVCLSVYGHI